MISHYYLMPFCMTDIFEGDDHPSFCPVDLPRSLLAQVISKRADVYVQDRKQDI
jgi:hypothetical protein